ncbi:unnamed protein product [Bursaphelenchus okinawaensis]|uniref:Serpentine receptor class gamma n=1 Tax=Bursaphelenchus okinawaensis TaxID=465554 RepID=A0A811KEV6_9BILA|nr:unnamed protein product [Bursaphelenchus okinawaensis]CAG9101937.1 unnamed protein product [Bursaphelenchus okinawaensis]
MDLMIRRHEYFELHWNCSTYNTSAVPDEVKRHPYFGAFLFIVSCVYMTLYVPCLYAMTRKELYNNPCYKIMVQMACCFWMAYSWAAVILAINRIASLTDRAHWFEGKKVYYWLTLPLTIGILSSVFGTPVAYSPILASYTFNPFIESVVDVDHIYSMPIHTADNLSFSILLPTIYIVFYLKNRALLRNKSHSSASKKEYSLFLQCLVISTCITMAATGYTFIQFLNLPLWIGQVSHILWLLVQGSPSIVYLCMNRSIQRILLKKVKLRITISKVSDSQNHSQTERSHNTTHKTRFSSKVTGDIPAISS